LVRHGIIPWRTDLVILDVMATVERVPDLAMLFALAAHSLQTELTARLEHLGLTPREQCVLIKALEGDRTQIQLAELCQLDKTTMVVTVDKLEQRGLVERRPAPKDRRARIIAVTEAGRELAEDGDALVQGIFADVLGSLPEDERDVFAAALARLVGERLADPPECVQPVRRPRQT
jgi:MarR family transcriptional regulator, transcriptional regulator for hemolysin